MQPVLKPGASFGVAMADNNDEEDEEDEEGVADIVVAGFKL